ncbi:pim1 [Symbiodinium necroappetens]|uniref:Pim1 protein n=1 Tax=Symbiodinium necroappetens TaxID=1628268 RepID=A0A812XGJ9_9DINO|nr:pim1 [Symbiodinium necroappetens]
MFMTMRVTVALVSGERVELCENAEGTSVVQLRRAAQAAFRRRGALDKITGIAWLISSRGVKLSSASSLKEAGLQEDEVLTGILRRDELIFHESTCSILRGDGSLFTVGDGSTTKEPGDWEECVAKPEYLEDVQQIGASQAAFAALLEDGSVVTWGDGRYGADSKAVGRKLKLGEL